MFKFYINILLFFFSFLISSSAISQSINGLKEVVSSQQEKIVTIEATLKKIIGSIENQSKNRSQNQNITVIENEINSINETINLLQNKINNITTLAYDLDFSIKRIERHIELSSINNKQVNNDIFKEKPNYKKNEQIEINKKSLDSKTNGVLGFIKEPANEDKQNKSLTEDKKVVNNDANLLPKGSVEDQFKIAENIAFGIVNKDIDISRVKRAAKSAQINDFIETLPEGYNTNVGERGVRLSGGQCQRIGIARALYKDVSVLVLDEATSALDTHTEKDVMDSISELDSNLTILIIAHRLTTVQMCDVIIELEKGEIVGMGTYDQLIQNADTFRNKMSLAD